MKAILKLAKMHSDSVISLLIGIFYFVLSDFHFKKSDTLTQFIGFEGTVLALLVSIFLSAFTIIDGRSESKYTLQLDARRNNLIIRIYDSMLLYVLPSSFTAIGLSIFEYYIISVEYIKVGSCVEKFLTANLMFFISYTLFSIYYLARDSIELSKRNFHYNKSLNK